MAIFNNPGDSIISSGGNIVGVDLVRKDVPNSNQGGNTIVYEGYTPEACTLSEITVFMKTLNTQGTYTATFTNVTTGNTVLSAANFNMQTLTANTWTTLTLTGTASDLSFAADDRFTVSFASNNTSFDGAGIYFTMRFTANSSFTPRAMDLLYSDTVTAATQASFSTGTLPTGYASYRLTIKSRTDGTGGVDSLLIYFNGDQTSSNYAHRRLNYDSVGVRTDTNVAGNSLVGLTTGAGAPANEFGQSIVNIVGPESTTWFKTWNAKSNSITNYSGTFRRVSQNAGFWLSTAAITSFEIIPGAGSGLVAGSFIRVYGSR